MSTKKATHEKAQTENTAEKGEITIPVVEIFRQMKKYLLIWVLIAVVGAALIFGGSLALSTAHTVPLRAMVGFSFDGIESGLDPNGNKFNANEIKSPTVIQQALTDLDLSSNLVDSVRSGITVSGVVPSDTIDKLTAYQSIFESNHSMDAAQKIMDTSYYPTRFEVEFSYAGTGLTRAQAAELLNALLNDYKIYFVGKYGYNEALGTALTSVDYGNYDYPEAVDVMNSSLDSLEVYVRNLAQNDTTRFRSTETGYTFADLQEAVKSLQDVDYDSLTAYIIGKNITKDKDKLTTYYQYRIDTLTRSMNAAKEQLASVTESIENYKKDSTVILAGADSQATTLTQPSEAYDKLIDQKLTCQENVSTLQQKINAYNERLKALKSKSTASDAEKECADQQLQELSDKINSTIELVNKTADDYFETVSYANAYNVLVPASGSTSSVISTAISAMMRPTLVAEALLFAAYLCFSVIRAFVLSYRQKSAEECAVETEAEESEEEETKE